MGTHLMRVAWLLVTVMAAAGTAQAQTASPPLNTDASPPLNTDASPPLNTDASPPLNTDAQPQQPVTPQDTARSLAFVSVESSLPWLTGNDLRRAIRNQTGFDVVSPSEAKELQPGTPSTSAPVMVITISRRGEVTVVCGDAPEGVQWIRVNTPMRSVLDATATLAAAVLSAAHNHQTHLAELQRRALEQASQVPQFGFFPAASLETPANPYYQPTPGGQPQPYSPPYNPYYFPRRI